jgi:hypothetical protein
VTRLASPGTPAGVPGSKAPYNQGLRRFATDPWLTSWHPFGVLHPSRIEPYFDRRSEMP